MVTERSTVACTSQYLTFKLDEELFGDAKCLVSAMSPKAQSGMDENARRAKRGRS